MGRIGKDRGPGQMEGGLFFLGNLMLVWTIMRPAIFLLCIDCAYAWMIVGNVGLQRENDVSKT